MTRPRAFFASTVTALALAACSARGAPGDVAPGTSRHPVPDSTSAPDSATLARLEREARALAKQDGCTTADQCRVAPLGAKACGGPRAWLVYCAATTDSAALFRKLAELEAAEKAYNRAHNIASDCSYVTPPAPTLSGGKCGG